MIQRIQSIYLLIVAILAALPCFLPIAYINGEALGFDTYLIYAVLTAIIPIIAFVSIFLFKRRVLQMRLNCVNMILMLFQLIAMIVYLYLTKNHMPDASIKPSWPLVLPLINMILTFLAIRAISIDEALVRSIDRLRK